MAPATALILDSTQPSFAAVQRHVGNWGPWLPLETAASDLAWSIQRGSRDAKWACFHLENALGLLLKCESLTRFLNQDLTKTPVAVS
jgi:hypothetical protein